MEGDDISLVDSQNRKIYVMNTENFDMYFEILSNYERRAAQMDCMPIWNLNGEQYVTFQVMSRQRHLGDVVVDDIKENFDRTKCHLCDVDIPSCYMESHESSAKHALYKEIADIALERVRSQMSVARPYLRTSSDNTYFCQYCCAAVAKSNSTVHNSTNEHRECVDRDKAVEKFLMKYKGNRITDFNTRNDKDELPFDKVPPKNCREQTKSKNSEAIIDYSNVKCSVVKFEEINAYYKNENSNQSINEDSVKEIDSCMKNDNYNDDLPIDKAPIKNSLEHSNPDSGDAKTEGSDVKIEEIKTVYYYKTDNECKIDDSIKSTKEIETIYNKKTINHSKLESSGVTFEDTEEPMKESVIKETSNDKAEVNATKKQVDDVKIKDENQKLCNEPIHNVHGETSEINSEYVRLEEISAKDSNLKTYVTDLNDISVNTLKYVSEDTIEIHAFDGSKVKVKVNNFNGYVDREEYVYCTLCDKQVTDVKVHRYDKKHMTKITALIDDKNCIRQVEFTKYHCVLCNQLLADKDEHLSMINHNKALFHQEISNTVNKNDESETLYQTDNDKLICIKCTEYVDHADIEKHINSDTHKYNSNKTPIDLKKIVVDDYCNVCKKVVHDKKHLYNAEHRFGIYQLRLSNGDILHYHLKDSVVPYKVCCKICDVELDKTKSSVDSHFSSESHISAYNKLLVENEIQKNDAFSFYYDCKVCKRYFSMIDVRNHIQSKGHRRCLLTATGKTSTMKQKASDASKNKIPHAVPYSFEFTDCPTKVRCKVCNIQVNYNINDLKIHNKDSLHKSNFSSMVKKNSIEKINKRVYYCQCCDDIVEHYKPSLMEHCFSHTHVQKFHAMGPPLDRLSLLIKARNKFAQNPKISLKLRKVIEVMMPECDTEEKVDEDSLSADKLDSLSFYTANEESNIDEADSLIENDCNENNNPVENVLEINFSNKSVTQSSEPPNFNSNSSSKDEDTIIHDRSVLSKLSINEFSVAPDAVTIPSNKIVKRDQLQDQDWFDPTEIVTYCFLVNESMSVISDESFEDFVHKAVNSENVEIYICKICGTEIGNNRSKIIQHMEGVKHDQNYRSLLLLNKMRENNENIFCDVCKELCNKVDLLNHLVKEEHTFNLEDSVRSQYEKYIESFENLDAMDQLFLAQAHKNFLMQAHGIDLDCKLCNVDVKDEIGDVKKHLLTENHFKAYESLLSENEVTRNKDKSFCEICKTELCDLLELQHIYSKHHIDGITVNNKCHSAENNVTVATRKRVRKRNKSNVIEKSCNTLTQSKDAPDKFNHILETNTNRNQFINDTRKVNYYYYNEHDSISKINSKQPCLNDQSEEKKRNDQTGQSKKNDQSEKKKSTLVSMVIKKADKVKMFTCVVCNKPIPNDPMTILNHNNSKIHSDNVREYLENLNLDRKQLLDTCDNKKSVVVVDVKTNNTDVVVDGFCTVCKKMVPNNPKNVIIHVNGKPHKDIIKLNLNTQKNVAPVVHKKSSLHNVVSIVGVTDTKVTDNNKNKVSECVQNNSHTVTNDVPTTESNVQHAKKNVNSKTNTTETITQNGFCTICKKAVPNNPQNIKEHVKGLSHQTKLKSKDDTESRNSESVFKHGMCTVCHKPVGNNLQNIKTHLQGLQHRSNLLSLASHSKTAPASNTLTTRSNPNVESKASESVLKPESTVNTRKISTNNTTIPVVIKCDPSINYNDVQNGFCKLCLREVTNNLRNIEEHIKGSLHQNNLKTVLESKTQDKGNETDVKKTVAESKLSAINKVASITETVNNINQTEVNTQSRTQENGTESDFKKTVVESKLSAIDKVASITASVNNINQTEVNTQSKTQDKGNKSDVKKTVEESKLSAIDKVASITETVNNINQPEVNTQSKTQDKGNESDVKKTVEESKLSAIDKVASITETVNNINQTEVNTQSKTQDKGNKSDVKKTVEESKLSAIDKVATITETVNNINQTEVNTQSRTQEKGTESDFKKTVVESKLSAIDKVASITASVNNINQTEVNTQSKTQDKGNKSDVKKTVVESKLSAIDKVASITASVNNINQTEVNTQSKTQDKGNKSDVKKTVEESKLSAIDKVASITETVNNINQPEVNTQSKTQDKGNKSDVKKTVEESKLSAIDKVASITETVNNINQPEVNTQSKTQDKGNESDVKKTVEESKLSAIDKVASITESVNNINQPEVNTQSKTQDKGNESDVKKTVEESKLSAIDKVASITESVNNINQPEVNTQQIDNVYYDQQRKTQNESNNRNTESDSPSINSLVMITCDIKENMNPTNAEVSTVVVLENQLHNTINSTVRVPDPRSPLDKSSENYSMYVCEQTGEISKNTEDILSSDVTSHNVLKPKTEDDKDSLEDSCERKTVNNICAKTDDTVENTEDFTNTDFKAINVLDHEMESDKEVLSNSCESTSLKVTAQTVDTFKNTEDIKDNDVKINNEFETQDNGFFLCRICDLIIANNPVNIREHLHGFRHQANIQKMREENMEMEKCYEKYYCDICDIKMDRISLTVNQHNESLAHLKRFDSMLKSNHIQTKKDVCYCEPCDLYFSKYSVPTHVKRQSHKLRFLDVELEI